MLTLLLLRNPNDITKTDQPALQPHRLATSGEKKMGVTIYPPDACFVSLPLASACLLIRVCPHLDRCTHSLTFDSPTTQQRIDELNNSLQILLSPCHNKNPISGQDVSFKILGSKTVSETEILAETGEVVFTQPFTSQYERGT